MFFQVSSNIEASSTFDHPEKDIKQLDTARENNFILRNNQRHSMKHETVQGTVKNEIGLILIFAKFSAGPLPGTVGWSSPEIGWLEASRWIQPFDQHQCFFVQVTTNKQKQVDSTF